MNSNALLRTLPVILLLITAAGGCKHKKKMQQSPDVAKTEDSTSGRCRLDFKSARTLGKKMKENEFHFDWVNAKANVESNFDDKEQDFDIRLSMRRDSAVLITIQYVLGLQVAKVLITRDSVKFVNYIDKTYFKGDINYINELLNTELDFEMVQAVLFGNSAEFHDEEDRLKPVADRQNCVYMLSTERKKRLRRIQTGSNALTSSLQILTMTPEYKIVRNEYVDPVSNRRFVANYSAFTVKDSVFAPYHVDIDISAQKKAQLKIEYVRIEKNTPQRLSLNIPAKYDAIKIRKTEKRD
jgi:hypothetical protein